MYCSIFYGCKNVEVHKVTTGIWRAYDCRLTSECFQKDNLEMVKAKLSECYNEVSTVNCRGVDVHLLSWRSICKGTRSCSAVNLNFRPFFPAKISTGNPLLRSMIWEPEWTLWTREIPVVHLGEQNHFRPDSRVVTIITGFLGIKGKFLDKV